MKKLIILFAFLMGAFSFSYAQKFAIVDMEYIMKHVPAYESANEQLNQVSKKWQAEVRQRCRWCKISTDISDRSCVYVA